MTLAIFLVIGSAFTAGLSIGVCVGRLRMLRDLRTALDNDREWNEL